jgi:hypothetical protein
VIIVPFQCHAIKIGELAGVSFGIRFDVQHFTPPTVVRFVGGDEAAHGGVHGVCFLTNLQTRSDKGRHASHKSEARVRECTRCSRLVTLADE